MNLSAASYSMPSRMYSGIFGVISLKPSGATDATGIGIAPPPQAPEL